MNRESKIKPIRSFVRREGRMTDRQRDAFLSLFSKYGLNIEDGQFEIDKAFARKAPVILEIGFGMGQSLLQMAKEYPEYNFVGIEVHRPGVGALLAEVENAGLDNIKVYCEDAKEILMKTIRNHSLSRINIYFPDPWPKKRHHKRRLIQTKFVELLIDKLVEGGILHFATDWQNYAEQMLAVLSEFSVLENMAGGGNYYQGEALRPSTKFEKRGLKLGHGVWDLVFCYSKVDA